MDADTPTVAVIIPCYNYAHYLKECIESVLAQTYHVNEIIVVDDGGKDNAKEIAEQCLFVTYIRKDNGGLASARNVGIKACNSEYIMCLDADDKLVPGAIEMHVELMKDDMTIAQCALMEFGERHVIMVPTTPTGLERIMQSNTVFCNAMFSKRMWAEVNGYDESETMRLGYEDWEFWIRLLAKGCHVETSDVIALRYRTHAGQMTQATSWPNRQKLYKYIYDKHKDLYEEKNLIVADLKL